MLLKPLASLIFGSCVHYFCHNPCLGGTLLLTIPFIHKSVVQDVKSSLKRVCSSVGGQEAGQTTAQASGVSVADKVAAGKVAAVKLSGEAARHRAHRATLMGASVKQQPAAQVETCATHPSGLLPLIYLSILSMASQEATPPCLKRDA